MDVLIIGNGGREHAITWKVAQSPEVNTVFCAPGNPGICEIAQSVDILPEDINGLCQFAKDKNIGLTIVGPETPLVDGIVDLFQENNLTIFGPRKMAAELEGSKVFSKNFMRKHGIPTAKFRVFDDFQSAARYVEFIAVPVVIKANGLAKGKGAIICKTNEEAISTLKSLMQDKIFGSAGEKVIVEEFLEGQEVSVLSITDGKSILVLETAQDYKAAYDQNKGPNTGGMGAYSPTTILTDKLYREIEKQVLVPTIHAMKREGRPFKGLLYTGLMVNLHEPKVNVLEYNVRFGDPETQPLMMRLKSDIVPLMLASINGTIGNCNIEWDPRPSVCVVAASNGYPEKYETDKEISGIDKVKEMDDVILFQAGTKKNNGKIATNGGRVLNITSIGDDIESARSKAYKAIEQVSFDGIFWRNDIAADL